MVSLSTVQASNSGLRTNLPGLVAVFVGATNGIGEYTLREFAKQTRQPRVYFVGRTLEAGERIASECKQLNPEGSFNFVRADVSLIRNVDKVCEEIKSKEKAINLLFMSQGTLDFQSETVEKVPLITSLAYYSRTRFMINLLPSIKQAIGLRRIVTVFTGTKEGKVFTNDVHGRSVPLMQARGHASSLVTTSIMALGKSAPNVTFIHNFPGHIQTGLERTLPGLTGTVLRGVMAVLPSFLSKKMPAVECGERHLFLATSARWPTSGKDASANGVALVEGLSVARGLDGQVASGVYDVTEDGESADSKVEAILAGYESDGTVDALWNKIEEEFKRILGV